MATRPEIIDCSGIVFFTCPFPSWRSLTDLLPPPADRRELGVELGLRPGNRNEYFIVTVGSDFAPGGQNKLPQEEKVRRVAQHAWGVLTEWGAVSGPMPEIIKGNPLDMLP